MASSIEEISRFKKQLMKRCIENALKIHVFFGIVFIKNPPKFDQKQGPEKNTQENTQNVDFFRSFGLPKTPQNPPKSKIDEKIEANNKVEKMRGNVGKWAPRAVALTRREWPTTAGGMRKSF